MSIQLENWLGVVNHVDLVVRRRDGRVAVARRRVVGAKLAIGRAHHLAANRGTNLNVWTEHVSSILKILSLFNSTHPYRR